ncbi:MAG: RNA polymerase sigma factor, partial [Peptostreptococcaceae bacterium]
MSELEFQRCLKEINSGNKNDLKIIYDYYGHAVYSYALSIVKNEQSAEDICQDVFVKLWNYSSKYRKSSNPKAWIMTITRNASIDYLRKYKREDIVDELNIAVDRDMAEDINEKIHISEVLSSLKDEEREVVILHAISDLTFKSIGEILDKPLGTVTWRYREAI